MLSSVFIDKRRKSTIAYFNDRSRPERRFDPINEKIRYPEVLVIGPNGESLGRMSSQEANKVAASYDLDLFCVAPNANPPVCKILNYGKYRYEQQKQSRISKKNQHIVETKQVQLHVNIGQHDLETKARHAKGFLEDGRMCLTPKKPHIGRANGMTASSPQRRKSNKRRTRICPK